MTPRQIKTLRKRLNLTQSGLAQELGINRAAVCQWEKGASKPSPMAVKFMNLLLELHERKIEYGKEENRARHSQAGPKVAG